MESGSDLLGWNWFFRQCYREYRCPAFGLKLLPFIPLGRAVCEELYPFRGSYITSHIPRDRDWNPGFPWILVSPVTYMFFFFKITTEICSLVHVKHDTLSVIRSRYGYLYLALQVCFTLTSHKLIIRPSDDFDTPFRFRFIRSCKSTPTHVTTYDICMLLFFNQL